MTRPAIDEPDKIPDYMTLAAQCARAHHDDDLDIETATLLRHASIRLREAHNALVAARNEALEEAAKLADNEHDNVHPEEYGRAYMTVTANKIAAAIRSLKESAHA